MSDNRFYAVYPAVCVDTNDPHNRSRIRVQCQQVLGQNSSNWAEACLPVTDNVTHTDHIATVTSSSGGTTDVHTHTVSVDLPHNAHNKVPSLGQLVWIMFIAGDPNFPVWIGVGA